MSAAAWNRRRQGTRVDMARRRARRGRREDAVVFVPAWIQEALDSVHEQVMSGGRGQVLLPNGELWSIDFTGDQT